MPTRSSLLASLLILILGCAAPAAQPQARPAREQRQQVQQEQDKPEPARRRQRATKESLLEHYDLTDVRIDVDALLAPGVPKDGIPALTDPKRTFASKADYPADPTARVVEVVINDQAVAYPIGILNWHEIVNDTVGGVPIAVTYCPLCDSVSVFDRRMTTSKPDGSTETTVAEFGVSGLLYNSNVVMYERTTMGLWSQVYMQAVSGPQAGQSLQHLPVRLISFAEFRAAHPKGEVLTTDTGQERPYDRNPYKSYFETDRLVGEFEFGDALPAKTLGLGIRAGDYTAFVTKEAVGEAKRTIDTPLGPVVVTASESGLVVESMPADVLVLQTFYHSWSAFYPETEVLAKAAASE